MAIIRLMLGKTEIEMLNELKEFFDRQENGDSGERQILNVRSGEPKHQVRRTEITDSFIIRNAILTLYYETLSLSKREDQRTDFKGSIDHRLCL
jgi:hypothetical protein